MRNLHQHAAAVASLRVSSYSTPMHQIAQDIEPLGHDAMGLAVLHVSDETYAASVLLMRRIIETRSFRQARITHDSVSLQRVGDRACGDSSHQVQLRPDDPLLLDPVLHNHGHRDLQNMSHEQSG
jgi:hypothetical protein